MATRQRRSAEDARKAILEAADQMLLIGGPANLRLQEVARMAGISHPTLLHHFGSREGLIKALNAKTADELVDYLRTFGDDFTASRTDLIRHVFERFRAGFAQRLLWLTMSSPGVGSRRSSAVDEILEIMHRARSQIASSNGHIEPSMEDTEFVFHLVVTTAVGDAVLGDAFRRAGSDADNDSQRNNFIERFRTLIRP